MRFHLTPRQLLKLCVWALALFGVNAWSSAAHAEEPQDLPPSPLEAEWEQARASERLKQQSPASNIDTRLIIAAAFDWTWRSSKDETRAVYHAGPAVGADATVCLLPWLGAKLSFREEWHSTEIRSFSSIKLTREKEAQMQGLMFSFSLEPRWNFYEHWSVFGGAGIAWARLGTRAMTLETADGYAGISGRSTVLVEVPLFIGAGFEVLPRLLQLGLRARYTPHISQTGALLDGGPGAGQVITDSGHRTNIAGLPTFNPALSLGLSIELLL